MLSTFNPPDYTGATTDKLAALRRQMQKETITYLLIPHADEYLHEWLAAYAERLAWLTHFTGSFGTALISKHAAHLFVPKLYFTQACDETSAADVTVHCTAEHSLQDWLRQNLQPDESLGFDPWLHSIEEVQGLATLCAKARASLVECKDNLVDRIWSDQPALPLTPIIPHGLEFSGQDSRDKRRALASKLRKRGNDAAVIVATDSIAWLLNIRGGDIPVTPLPFSRLIVFADGRASLFVRSQKISAQLVSHLGDEVDILSEREFGAAIARLGRENKIVQIDKNRTPMALERQLTKSGAIIAYHIDPCVLPKAIKNAVEIDGAKRAHYLDGLALTRFLYWLSVEAISGDIDECRAAEKLASLRRKHPELVNLSFPSISAAGLHAAIPHYVPSAKTNRKLIPGELYMIDSGGHYRFGTTDVTRTVAIGTPSEEMRDCFTRVLKGHIALARAVFPEGTTGAQLDTLARMPLWEAGLDYGHGTGHGVGSFLCVHEGPQIISTSGTEPLKAGMLVTNEPAYYRKQKFGLRIENMMLVVPGPKPRDAEKPLLAFKTLTLAPIDLTLIRQDRLNRDEKTWINVYHQQVRDTFAANLQPNERAWLETATYCL